jgi:hypothetical protein
MQLMLFDEPQDRSQQSSSGRTCQESSTQQTTPSAASLQGLPVNVCRWNRQGEGGRTRVLCMAPREQSRGASLTPNISAWPNDAVVCSLSQVLETTSIPQRYYLSGAACAGILRRAEKRGKVLPAQLADALQAVASLT